MCSQSIRPVRKNEIEVGDKLYIYWKQRVSPKEKDVHKIGEGVVNHTQIIEFEEDGIKDLNEYSEEYIACHDGFKNKEEMMEWFKERYEELYNQKFKVIAWDWE